MSDLGHQEGADGRTKIEIPTLAVEKAGIRERIIGQEGAIDAFASLAARLKSSVRPTHGRPFDVKFLAGPSGVGKTEVVKALAEYLNPEGGEKILRLDGGNFSEDHAVANLTGSPVGYVGSAEHKGSDGVYFSESNLKNHTIHYKDNAGKDREVVIILVDEAEKAHPNFHRTFLPILDEGKLMVNRKTVDFSNTVIIYTSNVGNAEAEKIREVMVQRGEPHDEIQKGAQAVMTRHFKDAFPPEFRGRVEDFVFFENLDPEAIGRIIDLQLSGVQEEFAANNVKIAFELSEEARAWLIGRGYNMTEGARALRKLVNSKIQQPLALAHDSLSLHRKKIYIDADTGTGELYFAFNEGEQLPDFTVDEKAAVKTRLEQKKAASKTSNGKSDDTSKGNPKGSSGTQVEEEKLPPVPSKLREELNFILNSSYDLNRYLRQLDMYIESGTITMEQYRLDPQAWNPILEHVRTSYKISGNDFQRYVTMRNLLSNAGIGSKEWWDTNILNK